MGNYYYGSIDILKSDIKQHKKLADLIAEEFYHGVSGKDILKATPFKNDRWDENGPVAFYLNPYASDGHFERIEELCQKLHVPYDRSVDGWDGSQICYYRPDVSGEEIVFDGQIGERTFEESVLRGLINACVKNIKHPTHEELYAAGAQIIDFLNRQPEIRDLMEYEGYSKKNQKNSGIAR